ncbi:MAG: FkbM family methyltransferase, partial [Vulcanimicrobiaceae bacterium]
MIQHIRSASTYVKQRKFSELVLRSKLLARETYDTLRYDAASRLSRDKYRLVRTNGYRMYVHLEDRGISKDLFLYGARERFACQVLKSLLKEDDVVLDIGANIGYYALLENEKATRGHIFACEPSPSNRELLQRNLALNDASRVRVFPFAFAQESKGGRPFYIYDKSNWASFNNELGSKSKIRKTNWVETITID